LEQAWEAHEMRKAGTFDEFQVRHFESYWETELPDELKPASMRAVSKVKVSTPSSSSSSSTIFFFDKHAL